MENRPVTTHGPTAMSGKEIERASDVCHWCGGDLAEGGSIRIQMNEGEPMRETCPDCFRDWPPEEVNIEP